MGRKRKYKVGDRIFYECYDGSIDTDIIIDIENRYYTDCGKEIPYQWLVLWRDGNVSSGIEDYSCLSPSNPKCKIIAQQFARFDRKRDEVIDSIVEIMSLWDKRVQEDIVKLLKVRLSLE